MFYFKLLDKLESSSPWEFEGWWGDYREWGWSWEIKKDYLWVDQS